MCKLREEEEALPARSSSFVYADVLIFGYICMWMHAWVVACTNAHTCALPIYMHVYALMRASVDKCDCHGHYHVRTIKITCTVYIHILRSQVQFQWKSDQCVHIQNDSRSATVHVCMYVCMYAHRTRASASEYTTLQHTCCLNSYATYAIHCTCMHICHFVPHTYAYTHDHLQRPPKPREKRKRRPRRTRHECLDARCMVLLRGQTRLTASRRTYERIYPE